MSSPAAIATDDASQLDAEIGALEEVLKRLRAMREAVAKRAADGPAILPDAGAAAFRDEDLIEIHAAAKRFRMAEDTIRYWCRTYGVGVRRGGRWRVSVSKMQARLAA
jgi:hypothetical protein